AHVEHLAEDVAEDIADVLAAEGIAVKSSGAADARVAVAIVGRALLRIAQHLVRLAALLEAFLGGMIARIPVGMMLQRHLAVSSLDLLIACAAADAKDFVVIGSGHVLRSAHASFCCELLATRTSAGRSRRSRMR